MSLPTDRRPLPPLRPIGDGVIVTLLTDIADREAWDTLTPMWYAVKDYAIRGLGRSDADAGSYADRLMDLVSEELKLRSLHCRSLRPAG